MSGNYLIEVTDANGCITEVLTIDILQPIKSIDILETISDFNGFNISCFGASDGSIEIVTSGGGGPTNSTDYTYAWTLDGEEYLSSTPTNLENLGPGSYEVTVTDIVGCFYSETYNLIEPVDITIIVDSEIDILCNGDLTGSISITPQGGTGDYEYFWTLDGEQFDDIEDVSNLGPGEYVVLVEDSNGCFESEVFYITQPDPIEITVDSTVDILCFGDFTGSIDVSVIGGVPDYEYNWVGPNGFNSNTDDISDLEAGTYTITVIDQNNCPQSIDVELTQPEDLIINYTSTDESCTNANDGTITLDIQGGVLDYNISWSNFGNGLIQSNLEPGSYTVTVVDSNNCVEEITIEILAAPLFDITPVVNSISCFGENDGNIQLNIEGGIAPVTVLWSDDPSAGEDRFNLSPGIYNVIITDSSEFSCTIEREFVIVEPTELITAGLVSSASDCEIVESGSIDLQVSGGTAPYTFEWNNGAVTEDLTNIPPGNYAVTVTDFNGCSAIDEFIVTRPSEILTSLDISFDPDCENDIPYQVTTINVEGGVAPYDIIWSSGVVSGANNQTMTSSQNGTVIVDVIDSIGCQSQVVFDINLFDLGSPGFAYSSPGLTECETLGVGDLIQFTNTSTGDYISVDWNFGDTGLTVINEENPTHVYNQPGTYVVTQTVYYEYGCVDVFEEILYVTEGYALVLPNAFTPNGDGINDTIRPWFKCMTNVEISIYDTFGSLIYVESGDDIYGWNGLINGQMAENGNYIIVVKATTLFGEIINLNGPITLIR